MGAPIERLIVASNNNDILTRTHETGVMVMDGVTPTTSPAMDIQVSSNFERLLFELYGRNGNLLSEAMDEFRATGQLRLPSDGADVFRRDFAADRASEAEVEVTIASVNDGVGHLIDPHTAVGVTVGRRLRRPGETMVELSCAHPAKFPDTVFAATGVEPDLPAHLSGIWERDERVVELANDLDAVESHVAAVTAR